jgi:hypothetical protein
VIRASVPITVALLWLTAPAAIAAPPNDDFGAAQPLSGFPLEVSATTDGATEEQDEPWNVHTPTTDFHTVWWRWTAPLSAPVAVEVCPPVEPSRLSANSAVYTGDTISSLTPAGPSSFGPAGCGSRDRFGQPLAHGSRTAFFAQAGRRYSIVADRSQPGPLRVRIIRAGSLKLVVDEREGRPRARPVYRAWPGERNGVSFYLDWDPGPELRTRRPLGRDPLPPVAFNVPSGDAVVPGSGCVFVECDIPPGAVPRGPLVLLGDGDDSATVEFSNGGTVVHGGSGDDFIWAGGALSGGRGDDDIRARTLTASRIHGGPGDDVITGSKRLDRVDPGPGKDIVNLRGNSTRDGAGERIDARDGEIDHVNCFRKDTVVIDALDGYPGYCEVRRHGGPARVIPDAEPFGFWTASSPTVAVFCSADAPRLCAGTVTISRRGRVFVHRRFAYRRCCRFGEFRDFAFRANRRKTRAMEGALRVTVRSRDRGGMLRTASGTYDFPPEP